MAGSEAEEAETRGGQGGGDRGAAGDGVVFTSQEGDREGAGERERETVLGNNVHYSRVIAVTGVCHGRPRR